MKLIFLKKIFLICIPALLLSSNLTIEHNPVEIRNREIDIEGIKEMGIDTFILNYYLDDAK